MAASSDSNNRQNPQGLWLPPLSRRTLLAAAGGAAMAAGLAACGGDDSGGTTPQDTSGRGEGGGATGTPQRGGNFRLGVTGGGSKDMMDGQNIVTKPDQARLVSAFETLLTFDEDYQLTTDGLAESVEPNGPKEYVIKLKQGITFQDGSPFNADAVIFSLQRIGTADNGLTGYAATASMDIKNLKKDNDTTVRLPLLKADSTVPQTLASYTFGMVPPGYKNFAEGGVAAQIGTGPYKLKSFTPGSQSEHERYADYWREGQPYFDTVTIIDFGDSTAQLNALQGGEIDAMTDVPPAQVNVLKGKGLGVLVSKTGGWVPLCMAIDMPPFDKPEAREAMRWIVDRDAMIQQIASGYGFKANDLYAPFDEGYLAPPAVPQRDQDLDKAKSLLKTAGLDGATIDLHTTNGAAGMVDVATIFAEQAKGAGIKINVKNDPNYYGDAYLKLAFSVDFWGTRGYLNQVQQGSLPSSPYNETHWPPKSGTGSDFEDLYNQALKTTDDSARIDIMHQMQQYEYDLGGYIIPFFGNLIDGYASNVQGLQPSKGTLNLDTFGHGFRTIWFA